MVTKNDIIIGRGSGNCIYNVCFDTSLNFDGKVSEVEYKIIGILQDKILEVFSEYYDGSNDELYHKYKDIGRDLQKSYFGKWPAVENNFIIKINIVKEFYDRISSEDVELVKGLMDEIYNIARKICLRDSNFKILKSR